MTLLTLRSEVMKSEAELRQFQEELVQFVEAEEHFMARDGATRVECVLAGVCDTLAKLNALFIVAEAVANEPLTKGHIAASLFKRVFTPSLITNQQEFQGFLWAAVRAGEVGVTVLHDLAASAGPNSTTCEITSAMLAMSGPDAPRIRCTAEDGVNKESLRVWEEWRKSLPANHKWITAPDPLDRPE